MRRRYRWDDKLNKLVEITNETSEYGAMIMPDLPDFVSPIDGKVVHGRAGLREHNKRHDVTNVSDFKETWEKQAEKRREYYSRGPRGANVPHLISALDKYRR